MNGLARGEAVCVVGEGFPAVEVKGAGFVGKRFFLARGACGGVAAGG